MQNQTPMKTGSDQASPQTKLATDANPATETKPAAATAGKPALAQEIRAKWSKIAEQDVHALKTRDQLVDTVVARYGLEKGQVQRDVDTFLNGRTL